ncbi:glutathione S-transferase family protein [Leptospira levettii]|nr:glutathione S-transferase [Leptospira levettii]MCW7512708.1 glutathione S-transferase [Leptospira levettii]TGM77392.1 glutathione S-transferase family protein [Leptospira levettii]TGM86226.1 glutathione S-transferase family protein [Leptospira levettii]TGM94165.1 glutathione S-transferase family protein [Leptospira levettii]
MSGNCYKVRLMLSLLNLKYESRIVNGPEKEHKSSSFLEMNPFGQVPVLKDNDIVLRDSQAILVYLAKMYGGKDWFPEDSVKAAEIVGWLSTSANEVSRGPSALRAHFILGRPINLEEAKSVTTSLLNVLEKKLSEFQWLVTNKVTIADIAIYPYIALAHQGNVSLLEYKSVREWMSRIEKLPGYVGMVGLTPSI